MTFMKAPCSVEPSTVLLVGLAGVGLLRALSATRGVLRFVWRKHLRPGKKLRDYGEWGLVTGASDGIGRAYCDYLAKQGNAPVAVPSLSLQPMQMNGPHMLASAAAVICFNVKF